MTSRAQTVLQEALMLPTDERRNVATELAASLPERTAEASGAPRSWRNYLDEGPFASKEFMTNPRDLPVQDR